MSDELSEKLKTKKGQAVLNRVLDELLHARTPEYKTGVRVATKELYLLAVEWVVMNEDVGKTAEEAKGIISICLIADVFKKNRLTLARDIIRGKKRLGLI